MVDDTLCHKRVPPRSPSAVSSSTQFSLSKRHKTLRFGLNWVVLGIAVPIPFRTDRYYCLPVLWRLYRKKGSLATRPAPRPPQCWHGSSPRPTPRGPSGWSATAPYVNAALLQGRPQNLQAIGPLHWKAALYDVAAWAEQKGPSRKKKGDRLPNPKAMIEDTATYPAELLTITFPKQARQLRVQVIRDVLWYRGARPSR